MLGFDRVRKVLVEKKFRCQDLFGPARAETELFPCLPELSDWKHRVLGKTSTFPNPCPTRAKAELYPCPHELLVRVW